MALKLLPVIKQRFFDLNGLPLAGGLLYTYVANTSTPLATYTDSTGSTPNTNPVVLDSSGYADVWLGVGAYKFVLKDSLGVTQFTEDNISVSGEAEGASPFISYAVTDGQTATDLIAQSLDLTKYSSAVYDVEIKRGTTVMANGRIAVQNLNGTARVVVGVFITGETHGVTFSVSQVGLVAQLRVATSAGPGAGTVKLSRSLVPV